MLTTANRHLTALQIVLDYLEQRDEPVPMDEVRKTLNLTPHQNEQLLVKLWEDGVIDSNEDPSTYLRTYWINLEGKMRQEQSNGIYDPSRGEEYVDPGGGFGFNRHTPDVPGRRIKRQTPASTAPAPQPEPESSASTFADDVERLYVLMLGAATDQQIDSKGEAEYKRLRTSLRSKDRFKKVEPSCVKASVTLKEFRRMMQGRGGYEARRAALQNDFKPLMADINGEAPSLDPVADIKQHVDPSKLDLLPVDIQERGKEMAEVYVYLYCIENSFRIFIADIMTRETLTFPSKVRDTITKLKNDEASNQYLPVRGGNDLYYCDFIQLGQIMVNNWGVFKQFFPGQNEHWLNVKMDELYKIRCLVAHNSYVGTHEREALKVHYRTIMKQLRIS